MWLMSAGSLPPMPPPQVPHPGTEPSRRAPAVLLRRGCPVQAPPQELTHSTRRCVPGDLWGSNPRAWLSHLADGRFHHLSGRDQDPPGDNWQSDSPCLSNSRALFPGGESTSGTKPTPRGSASTSAVLPGPPPATRLTDTPKKGNQDPLASATGSFFPARPAATPRPARSPLLSPREPNIGNGGENSAPLVGEDSSCLAG